MSSVGAQTVLVVEDEDAIAEAVRARLQSEGYQVVVASDGPDASAVMPSIARSGRARPDAAQGWTGSRCKQIQRDGWTPVLMLTARAEEADKVAGFAVGADDYLTKPFSLRELAVRVQAILRRRERIEGSRRRADRARGPADRRQAPARRGRRGGVLTPLEFDILHALAREPEVVLSRDQLMDRIWGYRDHAGGRVVDSHVARLRRKIGEDGNEPRFIRTVHGVGYAFKG